MSRSITSHSDVLRALSRARPCMRKSMLKAADIGVVKSICEIADNTLKGNVKLNSKQKSRLSRHKKVLRRLARKGANWKAKKRILVQKGGALIPLLLPLLGGVLSSLLQ
jgi:hypothetical protein